MSAMPDLATWGERDENAGREGGANQWIAWTWVNSAFWVPADLFFSNREIGQSPPFDLWFS